MPETGITKSFYSANNIVQQLLFESNTTCGKMVLVLLAGQTEGIFRQSPYEYLWLPVYSLFSVRP